MPFDATGFPEEDGSSPTKLPRVERWLHYFVAVTFILAALVLLLGSLWPIARYIWLL